MVLSQNRCDGRDLKQESPELQAEVLCCQPVRSDACVCSNHYKLGRSHCGRSKRLKVFENRVLRRIFGRKMNEWRRLQNKELYALYSSINIIQVIKSRRLRWAGHAAGMGGRRGAYRVLVGKSKGRRPHGRPRRT